VSRLIDEAEAETGRELASFANCMSESLQIHVPTNRVEYIGGEARPHFDFRSSVDPVSLSVAIKSSRIRYGTATPKSRKDLNRLIGSATQSFNQAFKDSKRAMQASRSIISISINTSEQRQRRRQRAIYSAAPNMQSPVS
jgi:hypothetical protein